MLNFRCSEVKVNRTKILFFLIGLGIFVYLINQFGVDHILMNMEKAGWSLLYVVLVWLVIYILNTWAWKLILEDNENRLTFSQLFMVTVSGFVINYITPFLAMGGEPYKVNALSSELGTVRSVSAVIVYRMVHLLGHMLLLLTGIVVVLLFLSLPVPVVAILALMGILILAVIILTFIGHRQGIFESIQNFFSRFTLFNWVSEKLASREQSLREMDKTITEVYHRRRGKFYLAIALEYISRICMGLEVYLILEGVGIETSPVSSLFLYVAYSILINLLFFIPLNIGTREGGLYLGLESLALPPLLGVYLGVVMRIREFIWILLGLLFILFTGGKQKIKQEALNAE